MKRIMKILLTAMAAIFLPLASVAWAQEVARAAGSITARAYQLLASGATITVTPAQDTDQNQRLKAAIEAALRARGYRVAGDSTLVLEFYATEVVGHHVVEKPNGARALESPVPGTSQHFRTGLLSGLNESLFGNQAAPRSPDTLPPPRQVHLSMTLTDQTAVRRIWQGSASGDVRRADSFAATQALVPFLVQAVGTTVDEQRLDLP